MRRVISESMIGSAFATRVIQVRSRRRRLLAPILSLLASVGIACHRDGLTPVRTPNTPASCLISRGCPTPAPLPVCAPGLDARPLDDVMAHARDLVNQRVVVRGPLTYGTVTCTQLLCIESDCCNSCGGALQLGTERQPSEEYEHMRARTLQLFGPKVACGGDDTLICCVVDVRGQDVIAQGSLLLEGMTWMMQPEELCAPP